VISVAYLLFYSINQIRQNIFQTFLLIVGISLSTSSNTIIFSLYDNGQSQINLIRNGFDANEIRIVSKSSDVLSSNISGFEPVVELNYKNKQINFSQLDLNASVSSISSVKYGYFSEYNVIEQTLETQSIFRGGGIIVLSVTTSYIYAGALKLVVGSWPTENDFSEKKSVLLLSQYFIHSQGISNAKEVLGKSILDINGKSFKIIGVFSPEKGSLDFENGRRGTAGVQGLVPWGSASNSTVEPQVMKYKPVNGETKTAIEQLRIYSERKFKGQAVVSHIKNQIDYVTKTWTDSITILILLSFLGCLASSICLLMLLSSKINRKTKEIGIHRALGASRLTIVKIFICETLILSIFGGIFGWIVAFALSKYLNNVFYSAFSYSFTTYDFTPSIFVYTYCLISTLILTFFLSVYPAIIASRIPPTEAFRE
jgi:ABC-type antimicrobial peptide transport system permease subunit